MKLSAILSLSALLLAGPAAAQAPQPSPGSAELVAACQSVIDQVAASISNGQATAAQTAQFRSEVAAGLAPVIMQTTAADIPKMRALLAGPPGTSQIAPIERCMTEARLRQLGAS